MMRNKGHDNLIKKYNLLPFQVQVLSKERTLCEKIMSLVRFSQQEDPYTGLANKIRHIYDIHMMLKNEEIKLFFESNVFNEMLNKVGQDDIVSYKNNNEWLLKHPVKAIIFDRPEETWDKIKTNYKTIFKELVIGDFPSETNLIDSLKIVAERLETVEWNI